MPSLAAAAASAPDAGGTTGAAVPAALLSRRGPPAWPCPSPLPPARCSPSASAAAVAASTLSRAGRKQLQGAGDHAKVQVSESPPRARPARSPPEIGYSSPPPLRERSMHTHARMPQRAQTAHLNHCERRAGCAARFRASGGALLPATEVPSVPGAWRSCCWCTVLAAPSLGRVEPPLLLAPALLTLWMVDSERSVAWRWGVGSPSPPTDDSSSGVRGTDIDEVPRFASSSPDIMGEVPADGD